MSMETNTDVLPVAKGLKGFVVCDINHIHFYKIIKKNYVLVNDSG